MHSLPIFVRLQGRPVILVGAGDAAAAKKRLLERAGAVIVGEDRDARIAIVAEPQPEAAVARLRARGILVNAVDRSDLCDFTLPAIVDRDPVLVAIGTGGASAGLAASLRQRLEGLLPSSLGRLATHLREARARLRERWPDATDRRRALTRALQSGEPLDPMRCDPDVAIDEWLSAIVPAPAACVESIWVSSDDPDELKVRDARLLAEADVVYHDPQVSPAILARARADAILQPAGAQMGVSTQGLFLHVFRID